MAGLHEGAVNMEGGMYTQGVPVLGNHSSGKGVNGAVTLFLGCIVLDIPGHATLR